MLRGPSGKLLRRKECLGLGEADWTPVIAGDSDTLDVIAETMKAGKKAEGHTAGAKGNKLQAYISLGFSSCHEPVTAQEVLERLRAGLTVFVREGTVRSDLEAISEIKNENIDFRRLALATDGVEPRQLINNGYMEFVVQKAINLGFNPVLAVQMATINVAQHFAIDDTIGGIAPGKYADILIIPDLSTIQPEYVISNGQVVAKNGQLLVMPRRHAYPKSTRNSVHLPKSLNASDFAIPVKGSHSQVKVRVIDMGTDSVTREALIDIPVSEGLAQLDIGRDVLKVAAVERSYQQGKTFTGFIRGVGLKHGAIASSTAADGWDIVVVGASEADMAQAVNRIKELNGGVVVCADNRILAELALPIGGIISTEPMETLAEKLQEVQEAAARLGCILPDILTALDFLTSGAIPFLRICEQGLIDLRQNRMVDLIVA